MIRLVPIALVLLFAAPAAGRAQVTVLQINDVYRIDEVNSGASGGMARVATLIDRYRARGENVLILHGGDFLSPSLESRYWGGRQMIDAMNFLNAKAPMLVVPGNHEYDASAGGILADAITAARFPWLAANLRLNTGNTAADTRILRDTIVRTGGMKIGLFGLTLIDTPRNYAAVDTAWVQIAEERIRALEQRGADIIVAVAHLDGHVDAAVARLRRAHPRFMWIASGHEHFAFSSPLTDTTALITNSEANARTAWRVTITPGASMPVLAAESLTLDSTVVPDSLYHVQIVDHYAAELKRVVPFFDQQIGSTSVPLDGREETVRGAESNWGDYLTDVMRNAFPDVPADVAVLNGGSLRLDDVVSGPIRFEHVARTFGFPTRVALVWLRGADLRTYVLEQSISGPLGHGRFLQVSGVHFTFDRRLPPGARVTDVQIQKAGAWQPLDPKATYVVAVPDYSYNGGDGYDFRRFALMTIPPGPDLRWMTVQALTDAFAQGKAIAPKVEGRIVEMK